MAALQLLCSPPQINPATPCLCRSFPSLLKFCSPDYHHPPCARLDPNVMPLNRKTPRPSPPTRTHLPVDTLAHLTLALLEGLTFAPLINSSLLPDLPPLSPDDIMKAIFKSLKANLHAFMLVKWRLEHHPPPYYTFPLTLTPHPFIGLGKFIAGRIDQIRAQKSYLAAHPSWSASGVSRLCPLCREEQETFSHVILRCPLKAAPRSRHVLGLTSVDPDAPL